jgi:transposase
MGWTAPLSTVAIDREIDSRRELGGGDDSEDRWSGHREERLSGARRERGGSSCCQTKAATVDVLRWFAGIDPAIIGIEACQTAHYWARELVALGMMCG